MYNYNLLAQNCQNKILYSGILAINKKTKYNLFQ